MADIILKNAQGVDETLTGVDSLVVPKSGGGTVTFSVEVLPPATPTDAVLFYSTELFTLAVKDRSSHWTGTLYYSTDHLTWNVWTGTSVLTASKKDGYYKLYLRGTNNASIVGGTGATTNGWEIKSSGALVKCCGNLNTLLSYSSPPTSLGSSYTFTYLFFNCGNVDFDVTLPATTLQNNCYQNMFYQCISLTKAPVLPALSLTASCYNNMFYGCTSLTTAPELPATNIAATCYSSMFQGCSSLISVPSSLPASTLYNQCYSSMFRGCYSLEVPPALPATVIETHCYNNMFTGCKSLVSIPSLPAVTLKNYCYSTMFNGCTNIKMSTTSSSTYPNSYRIPSSGTGTTATNSLQNMFANTGGSFTGTPTINTTYYTSNTIVS